MATSQLYPGLMVVPWYNRNEWRAVKDALCETDDKAFVLERLIIWKKRTPLLPCGIEGTLELMQVYVSPLNDNLVYADTRRTLKSQAIMRFLNICVAGRSKQGTFYKTAKDVGISESLINIRHSVAHDTVDLPDEFLLDRGLDECLKYVKEKYWELQDKTLREYTFREASDAQLHVYCEINILKSLNGFETLGDAFQQDPLLLSWCSSAQVKFDYSTKVDVYMKEVCEKLKVHISEAKIPSRIFFGTKIESVQREDGNYLKRISDKSFDEWKELVVLFGSSAKSLFCLIKYLIKIVVKGLVFVVEAYWLEEIFSSLLTLKNKWKDAARLYIHNINIKEITTELKAIQGSILNDIHPSKYNLISMQNFLRTFLKLMDFPEEYVEYKIQLMVASEVDSFEMPEPLQKFEEDFVKKLPRFDFEDHEELAIITPPENLVEEEIDTKWSRADPRMVEYLNRKNSRIVPYPSFDLCGLRK